MKELASQFEKQTGCASWINSDIYPDGKVYTKAYTEWLESKLQDADRAGKTAGDIEKLKEERDFYKDQNALGDSFIEEARKALGCGPKESLMQKISELKWSQSLPQEESVSDEEIEKAFDKKWYDKHGVWAGDKLDRSDCKIWAVEHAKWLRSRLGQTDGMKDDRADEEAAEQFLAAAVHWFLHEPFLGGDVNIKIEEIQKRIVRLSEAFTEYEKMGNNNIR